MNENFSIDPDPKFILKKKKKRRKYYEIKINFLFSRINNTFFWKEQESIV